MQNISRLRALKNHSFLVSYPRYPKTKYLDESSVEDFTQKWPTFVDMTGFQNAGDEDVKKTLDFVINGCFKDGTKLNTSLRNKRYNEMNLSSNFILGFTYLNSFMQDKYHQCATYLFEHAAFYVYMKENYFVVDMINRKVYYENRKF